MSTYSRFDKLGILKLGMSIIELAVLLVCLEVV